MKSVFTSAIFLIGACLVVALWAIVFSHKPELTFDALNSLVSGLAFVGLLATLAYQRKESEDREKAHSELLVSMRQQAHIQTTATLLTTFTDRWAALFHARILSHTPGGPTIGSDQDQTVAWNAANEYRHELAALHEAAKKK